MQQKKLKSNPIFAVLQCVVDKTAEATNELVAAVKAKKTTDNKPYFLISLADFKPDWLRESGCKIQTHHISVYEKFNDKEFVVSAYHYTATIIVNDANYTLHGYFNKFGQLLDVLVKDVHGNPVTHLEKLLDTFRKISSYFTVNILTDIFNAIDKLSTKYEAQLQEINNTLDEISEALYGDEVKVANIQNTAKRYLDTIRKFIQCQTQFNTISLQPDTSKINFLEDVLRNFKAPETVAKTSNEVYVEKKEPVARVRRPLMQKFVEIVPLIPAEIQVCIRRIEEIEKTSSADSLLEQHNLLNQCIARIKDIPENILVDLFIKQNLLMKKIKIALKMFVAIGNIDAVTKLIPLVAIIDQALICEAAMKNHTAVLKLLLNRYRGPRKISQLVTPSPPVYMEITYNEALPTPSLQALIDFGCDPNAVDPFGRSLLYIATTLVDIDRVRLLLDAGAQINYRSSKAKHRLGLMPEITPPPNLDPKTRRALTRAVFKIEPAPLKADTPVIDSTPIMGAVQKGSFPIVKLLKERGCDFTICDDDGMNAFSVALIRPIDNPKFKLNEEIIAFMINECGLDINMLHAKNPQRRTALSCIVLYKMFVSNIADDIAILLKFNADPNILCEFPNSFGAKTKLSSLSLAVMYQFYDLAELMLTQSRIRISKANIMASRKMIQSTNLKYLAEFDQHCAAHVERFRSAPSESLPFSSGLKG